MAGLVRRCAAWIGVLGLLVGAEALAQNTAPAAAPTIEAIATRDGELLAARRYAVPGGVPVICFAGIGSNALEFDLPGRSLARRLAADGFEVWLVNVRATGLAGERSSGDGTDGFDTILTQDVDAAVQAVGQATGERPFLLGHSQGGLLALGWLQGVALEVVPVRQSLAMTLWGPWPTTVREPRIVQHAALAQSRNAAVRGVVALAAPARFAWKVPATPLAMASASFYDYNVLFTASAWSPQVHFALLATPFMPARALVDFLFQDLSRLPFVGPDVRPFLTSSVGGAGASGLFSTAVRPGSIAPDVLTAALELATDDLPTKTTRQFLAGTRLADHVAFHELTDVLYRPYSYADGLVHITAPTLWVAGSFDKVASDDVIERHVPTLGGADKTFLRASHGHIDLVIGDTAPQDVWGPVSTWLKARR